jgi:hypothetical protein
MYDVIELQAPRALVSTRRAANSSCRTLSRGPPQTRHAPLVAFLLATYVHAVRENIEATRYSRAKTERTTLTFPSVLVLAPILVMSPQSSTPNTCQKLRMHTCYAVDIGPVGSGIVWDGEKITRSQFDHYLRQQRTTEPGAIFMVRWDQGGLKNVPAITEQIRSEGFAVAMNCPPIPL